jgi:hypothetical protein
VSNVQKVKDELAHVQPSRRCCKVAELSALLHTDGTFTIRGREGHLFATESSSPGTARKIYSLFLSIFSVETSVLKVTRSTPRRGNVYRLEIPEQPGFHQVLNELGVLDSHLSPEPTLPSRIVRNDCCVSAALRGAFLGGGYVSEPYGPADLEISFSTQPACLSFEELMRRKSLSPRKRERRGHWVLYMKRRSDISSFLAATGAHEAHLAWESQAIMNATRNSVNRLVNCDAANAGRLAQASSRQREILRRLEEMGALERADEKLKELALTRLANPQASLSELGKMLEPPVSKSVVQGRMARLERMLPPEEKPVDHR